MSSVEQRVSAGGYGSLNGSMDSFLTDFQADLAEGLLSPRVLNDPELHRAELERIFTRCWVFVGHVSEIPSPGDYVLRYVGEDQFILVRDEDGEIQLLFNNCVHRGSPVCRAERGNASHFRCPYHGWIYKNSGEWNGAPKRAKAYRKLDAGRWGLRRAPHVDSYQGLIFANLDPGAISLTEYLGDMCWYLDVMFGLNEQGREVVGEPHRWIIPSNWKSGAENFVGDAYHVPSLHKSIEEIGFGPPDGSMADAIEGLRLIAVDGGHGVLAPPLQMPPPFGILGYPPQVTEIFDLDRVSAEQRQFLEGYSIVGFTIFPNLSLFNGSFSALPFEPGMPEEMLPEAMPYTFTLLRQWQPRGPENFELWNWSMQWKAAPTEFNEKAYNLGVKNFSPSGIFEQDDTVAWAGGPRLGRSQFARQGMKLNLQMGLDGMSDFEIIADCPWPGEVSTSPYGELNQRRWWQRWAQQLAAA